MNCKRCDRIMTTWESQWKGMCSNCIEQKGAGETNDTWLGQSDGLPTFSFEFEIQYPYDGDYDDDNHPLELLEYDFVHSEDCTVDAEWKSPIYQSVEAFLPVAPLLDRLAYTVGGSCGTHIHTGFSDESRLRLRNHHSILDPLYNHIHADRSRGQEIWGRISTNWANRAGWVETYTNHPTIEWRLPKFNSSRQYTRVILIVRTLAAYLDGQLDHPRSREAYARIGNTLIDLYEHTVNLPMPRPTPKWAAPLQKVAEMPNTEDMPLWSIA